MSRVSQNVCNRLSQNGRHVSKGTQLKHMSRDTCEKRRRGEQRSAGNSEQPGIARDTEHACNGIGSMRAGLRCH